MDKAKQTLSGRVLSGRGKAAQHIEDEMIQFQAATGEDFIPGSLNIALDAPVFLDLKKAKKISGGYRLLWPAMLFDQSVWIYRFPHAPLHVVEVLSTVHLRKKFNLQDGQTVPLKVNSDQIISLDTRQHLAWVLLWKWRETWSYSRDNYYMRTRKLSIELGATQVLSTHSFIRSLLSFVKRGFK